MNWFKLKEKFPAQYKEIRELHFKTKKDGRPLLELYLKSKGVEVGFNIIPPLRQIEFT